MSESGFERADALRVRVFAQGEGVQCNPRVMQSLEDSSVFFKSMLEDTDLSWSVLDTQALEEAEVDFGQSLETCPAVPQKRQSLFSRWC